MDDPEKCQNLAIRVLGLAVSSVRLTREQQMDVINRTFHGAPQCLTRKPLQLEAKSPYEIRVHLGDAVPEQSVREALATRKHGVSPFVYDRLGGGRTGRAGSRVDDRAACGVVSTAITRTRGP